MLNMYDDYYDVNLIVGSGMTYRIWESVVVLEVCGCSGSLWLFWESVVVLEVCGCSGSLWLF